MPQKIGNLRPSVWPTETNMCEKVTTVTNWNDPDADSQALPCSTVLRL